MQITHRLQEGIYIVAVAGALALEKVEDAKHYLDPLFHNMEFQGIVFSCENMTAIDSNGIGLLVSVFKRLENEAKPVAVVGLNNKHQEVLRMLSLDKILILTETLEAALAQMRNSRTEERNP